MKSYMVNVDRGLEQDPLTGRVMDLRGESGPPFVHRALGTIVETEDVAAAELLVKRGFLVPVVEKRSEQRVKIEK